MATEDSQSPSRRFAVAFSFPGEHRDYVRRVAEALLPAFGQGDEGKAHIFYDDWHEDELIGYGSNRRLQQIYCEASDLIVPFYCQDYVSKPWCGVELRAIEQLLCDQQYERVLPFRFDMVEIPSSFTTDIFPLVIDRSPEDVARLILDRYNQLKQLALKLPEPPRGQRISRIILRGLIAVVVMLTVGIVVLGALYYRRAPAAPEPLPLTNTVIADFTASQGTGALTANTLPFSLMSDSSQNMQSRAWYERIHEDPAGAEGYLRIHYELMPAPGREGYVGLYGDFTLPPPKPVDLSAYHGISLRIRLSPSDDGKKPNIRFVLYSDNIENLEYAYPIAQVIPSADWSESPLPFSSFVTPPHAHWPVQLDRRRVFRFAIMLTGGSRMEGHVDVDNIALY